MQHEFAILDPLTLDLMSALQLQPRASWASLSQILGVSPTTLARRWQLLTEERLAWITCIPAQPTLLSSSGTRVHDWFFLAPHGISAVIEVVCRPGERERVITPLLDDERCWTIACTSGSRDLLIAVTVPSGQKLDEFLQHKIGKIPNVLSIRAHPLRGFLQTASSWRIGSLSSTQRKALVDLPKRKRHDPGVAPLPRPPSKLERAVIRELGSNARASASEVARRTGYSVSSVNEAIAHVLAMNMAELRLDFAQAKFGWDVNATLALRAPQSRIAEVGTQLRRFSLDVREAMVLTGGANLYVHIWTKLPETVDAVEEMLDAQFPDVRVSDRWLTTHHAKRAGVVLDEFGLRSWFTQPLSRD